VIKKERSLVSKNSNSFNAMIKRSSVTINNSHLKKITFIATAIILLSVTATFGVSPNEEVFAKKPQSVMELSNGAPSGPHHNLNILGKKLDFNCDESEGGGVVFTPTFTEHPDVKEQQTISFVSNKKSQNETLYAIDPCTEHFSPIQEDGALVHLPSKFDGQTVTFYEVYMAIKGKPDNGGSPSKFVFSNPTITQACNIVEVGDAILTTDSDFGDELLNFNATTKHTDNDMDGIFESDEIVYLDLDSDGFVSMNDKRIANAQLATNMGGDPLENGSLVVATDSDAIMPDKLIGFLGDEKFGDAINPDDDEYDIGEAIYRDDGSGDVSVGDTRLFVPEGSEALSCESTDAVTALGTVTNNGAFVNQDGTLERFTPEEDQDENPHGKKVGKGKSRFVDMSGLFTATGAICDATILDTWDLNFDGVLTREDFDAGHDDSDIDAADLTAVGIPGDTVAKILAAETDAIIDSGNGVVDGLINTHAEFAAFLENEFGGTFNCVAFYDAWVFTIADIVEERLDIDNDGATTVQIRFYPRFT